MNEKEISVPYIVHESEMTRSERNIKRLWVALIIAVVFIVVTNMAWLLYINQYDFIGYEYSQDGEGVNIIGNENGVSYNGAEDEGPETDAEE
jgi:hypothetical protein